MPIPLRAGDEGVPELVEEDRAEEAGRGQDGEQERLVEPRFAEQVFEERDIQKMTRKRTMNQDQSTAILIPRTWKSVIEPPPSMPQW